MNAMKPLAYKQFTNNSWNSMTRGVSFVCYRNIELASPGVFPRVDRSNALAITIDYPTDQVDQEASNRETDTLHSSLRVPILTERAKPLRSSGTKVLKLLRKYHVLHQLGHTFMVAIDNLNRFTPRLHRFSLKLPLQIALKCHQNLINRRFRELSRGGLQFKEPSFAVHVILTVTSVIVLHSFYFLVRRSICGSCLIARQLQIHQGSCKSTQVLFAIYKYIWQCGITWPGSNIHKSP